MLQEKLVALVAEYLIAQVAAGASAVQLFDSWVGALSPAEFERYALPYLKAIVQNVRAKTNAPIIYFATNTAGLFPLIGTLGVDVVGADWRISLPDAYSRIGAKVAVQGNLDPTLLFAESEVLEREVRRVVSEGRTLNGYVFNLGHGILPATPIANVELLLRLVRE